MHIVVFDPSKQKPPRNGPQSYSRVALKPGRNEISDRNLEILQNNPSAKRDMGLGAIAIEEQTRPDPDSGPPAIAPAPDKPAPSSEEEEESSEPATIPGDLNEYSVADALPLIEGQEDITILEYWLSIENDRKGDQKPRKGIKDAIAQRLEELAPNGSDS